MATITRLEAQKKNKNRVNVYIDGQFSCGIGLDDIVRNRLAVGTDLTEAELGNLQKSSDENKYFTKTLEYILKSPKTELQIKQYLYKNQLEPDAVNRIIAKLKTLNYINDAEYARNFTETKSGKLGSRAIAAKLHGKGIKREILEEFTSEIDPESQLELALSLAGKYMRNKTHDAKNLAKLYRYLLGKGFENSIVQSVKEAVCKSE